MSAPRHRALVVRRIKDGRYFYGFTKSHAVQTAWTLAGAKFFQADSSTFEPFDASRLVDALGQDAWEVVEVGA